MSKKVRVEVVAGEGAGYRDPSVEQRVSVDARAGLTRRWRRFPAFVADLLFSFVTYLSVASAFIAIVTAAFLFDEEGGSWKQVLALLFFALLTPILWVGGQRLSRRRHKWRNARRVHDHSELTIGRDVLRFGDHVVNKQQVERVRVKKEKSRPSAGAHVEVRFDVVLDIEGAKSITALKSLEEHELQTVLAAFDEGGLEVE